jgi:hypothetical protein
MDEQVNESVKENFSEFLRQKFQLREDSIASYLSYLDRISSLVGTSISLIAESTDSVDSVLRKLPSLKLPLKSEQNCKTALNRLRLFVADGADNAKVDLSSIGPIMRQVNELEEQVRDHEDSICRLLFGLITTYILAMPPLVSRDNLKCGAVILLAVSVVMALLSLASFVPVLRRKSRQLDDIRVYGERLVEQGKSTGRINPAEWSNHEKICMVVSAVALLISLVLVSLSSLYR